MDLYELYDYLPQQCIYELNSCGSVDECAEYWANELDLCNDYTTGQLRRALKSYAIKGLMKMDKKTLAEYCVWLSACLDDEIHIAYVKGGY
jgi:hypothetical protein